MHHLADRITHTTAFVTPVVEHLSETETTFSKFRGLKVKNQTKQKQKFNNIKNKQTKQFNSFIYLELFSSSIHRKIYN